ncbi:hypothetical protein ACEQPO_11020 [Bacillus sp. SL00103]
MGLLGGRQFIRNFTRRKLGASRILIIELTPKEKRGQFFGLFAFSGRCLRIGPIIYGSVTLLFAEHGNLQTALR